MFDPTRARFAPQGPASPVPPLHRSYRALRLPHRIRPVTSVSLVIGLRFFTERAGLPGAWVIFFKRAMVQDPAEYADRPPPRGPRCCLQTRQDPGHSGRLYFGAVHPRLTRSRTYASPGPLPPPSQGSLPTCWLLWSDGFCTHEMTSPYLLRFRSSFPYGPALPGRTGGEEPAVARDPREGGEREPCPCVPSLTLGASWRPWRHGGEKPASARR